MKNKGIIIAIVIAILILIAVIVVYFTSQKKAKASEPVNLPTGNNNTGSGSTVAVDSIDDDTPIYTKVLNRGIPKCIEVKMLQQRLNAMGASLEDDGVFGPPTSRKRPTCGHLGLGQARETRSQLALLTK